MSIPTIQESIDNVLPVQTKEAKNNKNRGKVKDVKKIMSYLEGDSLLNDIGKNFYKNTNNGIED